MRSSEEENPMNRAARRFDAFSSIRSLGSSIRHQPSQYVYQAATLAVVLYLLLSAV
jgi:hypothetical protein